jgi:acetyl esterase/lipase
MRYSLPTVIVMGLLAISAQAQPVERQRQRAAWMRPTATLEYARPDNTPLLLDLYVPSGEGPHPVILWIHGGGWQSGSRRNAMHTIGLIREGFAVASIDYRLTDKAIFPAQIEDCKAAVRFLRSVAKEYKLDAERIGAFGASAGGHLAALLGTSGDVKEFDVGENLDQSSRVQAVCDLFGPADFTMGMHLRRRRDTPDALLLGGPVSEKREAAIAASPVTYVTEDDPPFLIIHGERDPVVNIVQSVRLHQVLEKGNVESKLIRIPGAGHGTEEFARPEIREAVYGFFKKHLMDRPTTRPGE